MSELPSSSTELRDFYESGYSGSGEEAMRSWRWRELGAQGKADRALAGLAGRPAAGVSLLDIGCGDGALLAALRDRRPGWTLAGVEVAEAPARLARERNPGIDIRTYDGDHLPYDDDAFDVGVLSHVVEHVLDPVATLVEASRVCRTLVVEVPLEANLSAARTSKRRGADELGHLRHLSRGRLRRIVAEAGLTVAFELTDPLPREVHRFHADDPKALRRADARWAVRAGLHRLSARAAARLFTLHLLVVCERARPGA